MCCWKRIVIVDAGDILGPSVDGAGDLIDMPGGCGEQKMINIAPAVYMLDYLEITKTLTADMKVTLEKQLLDGMGWLCHASTDSLAS